MMHVIEKKRLATEIKGREKLKFMRMGVQLEQAFTEEVKGLKDQY